MPWYAAELNMGRSESRQHANVPRYVSGSEAANTSEDERELPPDTWERERERSAVAFLVKLRERMVHMCYQRLLCPIKRLPLAHGLGGRMLTPP